MINIDRSLTSNNDPLLHISIPLPHRNNPVLFSVKFFLYLLMASPTVQHSPLRTLFFAEAVLKLIGGAIFIISPTTILKNLTLSPYSSISTTLVRSLGTQTLAFSIPLFLAARKDRASAGSRRVVYWALLAREGFLMAGLVGQAGALYLWGDQPSGKESADPRAVEEGLAREELSVVEDRKLEQRILTQGIRLWVAELVPFVAARMWVLGWRQNWFEG